MEQKDQILGIDLGGTNTKIGVGSRQGKIQKFTSIPTLQEKGFEDWANRVLAAVRELNTEFSHVGIGSPGPLDLKTGTILSAPNLKNFCGHSITGFFEKSLQKKVFINNDANCGVLAEYFFGEFKNCGHLVLLTLGTGVGSGVISDHRLILGSNGFAPEIGHMILGADLSKPTNSPFEKFSFESQVGATQSAKNFAKAAGLPPEIKFHEILSSKGAPREAFVDQWSLALAYGIYNSFVIFNPKAVILGGGVSSLWTEVEARLKKYLETWLLPPIWIGSQLKLSALGDHFGVLGAIALTLWNEKNERK